MKKISIVAIISVMLTVMLTGCSSVKLADCFKEDEVKKAAEEIITLWNQNQMSDIVDNKSSANLQSKLTADRLQQAKDSVMNDAGAFTEYKSETVLGSKVKGSEENYAVYVAVAKYENQKVTYTITFDESMKLDGIFLK